MKSSIVALALLVLVAGHATAQTRVSDYTTHGGDVPVRLVGYGLVVGLNGTGDRSFGTTSGAVQTVRSVTNLLRGFHIEVPSDRLLLRNVAAVLVTAEVSPYMRPGGRFEVQVASLGDASSLRGGVLWITPLTMGPESAAIASAQGPLPVTVDERVRFSSRGLGSARITDAGILEMPLPVMPPPSPILLLKSPDLGAAARIVAAINAARGPGTAVLSDAGAVTLKLPAGAADSASTFLAAIDTIAVVVPVEPKIVIDARSGIVVAGGDIHVGNSVVSIKGITVRVGDSVPPPPATGVPATPGSSAVTVAAPFGAAPSGMLALGPGSTVRDIAAGLQALGALPSEVAAVFDGLRAAGAIVAPVTVR
ncbi:MAG TPA: flagellar basal body P-ring protein FlgI [Gemmatimonadales bacterium]